MILLIGTLSFILGFLAGGWFMWFIATMDNEEKPEFTGRIIPDTFHPNEDSK